MKKILALVAFLVVAAACSTAPPATNAPVSNTNNGTASNLTATVSEADVTAREKATWEAIKAKDFDGFANMMASDYIEIGGDGVFDKAGIVAYLKDVTITDVTFADWKMLPIDKDAVLVTYNVTIKGRYKSETIPPGPYRAASAWVNRDGKWSAIFYQETLPSTTPPPPAAATAAKSVAGAAAAPAAVAGPDPIANEKAIWDAIKGKNYDAFAAMLAPEAVEVEADGVYDKAGSVKGVSMLDFSKTQLSAWKSVKFDSDASLVTYMVTTPSGKPPQELHSTIWINRGGKWLALYHQGTPVQAPAAAAKPAASPK